MLTLVFWVLLVAGGSAVVVLWVFAVATGYGLLKAARAGSPAEISSARWLMLPLWPFAMRELPGVTASDAQRLNKMLVGVFAAFLVAAGSAAVYSNLTFVPPAQTDQ